MKRVLVTPLDWGLGHASRCVPIIRELLQLDYDVLIGGSGDSLSLLKEEFPSLRFFELPSYAPVYSASTSLVWKMTQQLYKFIKTINKEHQQTERLVESEKVDIVISDNRYGCWSRVAKSIFMTHQVTILLPKSIEWMSGVINFLNHYQIENFHECWVPDWKEDRLAGRLSHTDRIAVKYVGPLSRFQRGYVEQKKMFDILVILSGPEPQRSILEEIMLKGFHQVEKSICIVRGVPGKGARKEGKNICIVDFLNSTDLQLMIQQSDILISRSGYSTIMDLAILGGKVVFIPTPGQPEQEYLAQYLKEKGIAVMMEQNEFDLNKALEEIKKYSGFQPGGNNHDLLRKAVIEVSV